MTIAEAGQLVFGFISLVSKYAAGMTSKWRPISFCQLAASNTNTKTLVSPGTSLPVEIFHKLAAATMTDQSWPHS